MSITTLSFGLFLILVAVFYFAVPPKRQWWVLLLASLAFYFINCKLAIVYILCSSLITYCSTNLINRNTKKRKEWIKTHKNELTIEEKNKYKLEIQKKNSLILVVSILLCSSLLLMGKYLFLGHGFIVPLGISFFTLQSLGYIVDVFWEEYEAETNYAKVLLFLSFFPQMTQGPISSFNQLGEQLFAGHSFEFDRYSKGILRLFLGFFKKMVIANTLSKYVQDAFQNYSSYSSIAVLVAMVLCLVNLYMDFSAYMDIICGYCEILGIKLVENFDKPFSSKSISEFWRRWHISLGAWVKRYLYYPVATSKLCRKLSSGIKNKYISIRMPQTVALLIAWLFTGLWHGFTLPFFVWGMINGGLIILSIWAEPITKSLKKRLNVSEHTHWFSLFQVLKTILLMIFVETLAEAPSLKEGAHIIDTLFSSKIHISSIWGLLPLSLSQGTRDLASLVISLIGLLSFLVLEYSSNDGKLKEKFTHLPLIIQSGFKAVLVILIVSFGVPASWATSGFMYANF